MNYKKIIFAIGFLAVFGLMFNFSVPHAQATTVTELQTLIQQFRAQILELQRQIAEIEGRPVVWCHDFEVNLRVGDRGSEVKALQRVLRKENFEIIEAEKRVAYFGPHTAAAAVGFQEKYREEILAPWGLRRGTGFIGSTTRAKLNKLFGCDRIQPPLLVPLEQLSITILSPVGRHPRTGEGGDTWTEGKTYEIRWDVVGVEPEHKVDIILIVETPRPGHIELNARIASDVLVHTEKLSWTVPEMKAFFGRSDIVRDRFRVLIRSSVGPPRTLFTATSYFSIVEPVVDPVLPPVIDPVLPPVIDPVLTPIECITDRDCMWCGLKCVPFDRDLICPTVMPPMYLKCVCRDGICKAVPIPGFPLPSPNLRVTPTEITIELIQGTDWTDVREITVGRPTEWVSLTWEATDDMDWLYVTPNRGTIAFDEVDELGRPIDVHAVTVRATTEGLAIGTHTGTITFTGASPATGSPDRVIVNLTVTPPVLDPAPDPAYTAYLLFDTHHTFMGNLGGRVGANNKCNIDPDKPAICVGDAWAFISVSRDDEIADMPTTKGVDPALFWHFRDANHAGVVAAVNWRDLLDGTMLNTPADGGLTGDYWTGSLFTGNLARNCEGWTKSQHGYVGITGEAGYTDFNWIFGAVPWCMSEKAILCACRADLPLPEIIPTKLYVTPTLISGSLAQETGWTAIGTFSVTNPGVGTLNWSVTDNLDWVRMEPSSGTATDEADVVTIKVDARGLAVDLHMDVLTFRGAGQTRTVSVLLNVTPPVVEHPPAVGPVLWDLDFCTSRRLCAVGQGDCDRHSDCAPGLFCAWNVGAEYGQHPSIDVCRRRP